MSGPSWLADLFAAVMLVDAGYSTWRLTASRLISRPTHADIDVMHVLMGVAMAGMLVASFDPVPSAVWEVAFSALGVWFAWRCYTFVRRHGAAGRDEDQIHHLSHYTTHVVMAAAMLYMYFGATSSARSTSGGMVMSGAGGSAANLVGLPLVFLIVLCASGIWELDSYGQFAQDRAMDPGPARAVALASARTPATTDTGGATRSGSASEADGSEDTAQPGTGGPHARWLAPGSQSAAHVAMCITVAYMLIVLL